MQKLQRVCVGTNFSAESAFGLQSAAMLARATGAHVDLVHVVQRPTLYERVLTPIQSHLHSVDELVTRAREHTQREAGGVEFSGLSVGQHVLVGVPFAELLRFCHEQRHDLLVVGTRKRSGIGQLLLGSTAERVLRKATLPVLLAKRPLATALQVILAPTDFSEASRLALEEAVAFARRWNARLVFLHVIEPIVQAYGWTADLAGGEIYVIEPEELKPEWDALLAGLDLSGVRWEQQTIKGDAALTVTACAESLRADVLVMGTHGRSGLAHALLGSVTEAVARATETCVLTVRAGTFGFDLP